MVQSSATISNHLQDVVTYITKHLLAAGTKGPEVSRASASPCTWTLLTFLAVVAILDHFVTASYDAQCDSHTAETHAYRRFPEP